MMLSSRCLLLFGIFCCFSPVKAVVYNIFSDSNGYSVKMRSVISLGKPLNSQYQKEYTGPIFRINVDSLKCSRKNFDKFEIICEDNVVGYIVFGKQIASIDPQLELPGKPHDDFEINLVQDGACGDFRLLVEPKSKSAPTSPISTKKK
jgi:hypothetical protein